MNLLKQVLPMAVLTIGLFGGGATDADAADRFAIMKIENHTNMTINFQYKFGEFGPWIDASIPPGGWQGFHSGFTYPNSYQFDSIYIRYDEDLRPGRDWFREVLPPYVRFSPDINYHYGYVYAFSYDGYARQFLRLS